MAKADPTLVKASMLEAKTRAASDVPNMKPLFDATTEISETYLTQFQNVMKTFKDEQEKQRLALEKQMELFQISADKAFQSVYELEEPLPDVMIKAFEKEVNNLQDQFEKVNTIGEGDSRENRRARAKIMAELTKLKNNSVNLRKTTTEVLYNISSGSVNTSIVDPASLDPARMVLELGNLDELADQGKVKVTYGKDGAIFTVKDYYSDATSTWGDEISFTMNDLKETFPPTDPKLDKDIVTLNKNSGDQGTFDATGNNPQYNYKQPAQKSAILDIIKDKEDFKDVSQRRIEGLGSTPSFKEALMEDISIPFSVLDKMFYDENGERVEIGQAFKYLDYNEDGEISNEDASFPGVDPEAFKNNIAAMLDAIVNPDNPAFSLDVSKELFADYYVSIDEQTYRKNFEKTVKANQRSNRNSGSRNKRVYRVNNRDMSEYNFNNTYGPLVDFLENPEEKQMQLPSGRVVKYENGKYYGKSYDTSGNYLGWAEITANDIAEVEGISEYVSGTSELAKEDDPNKFVYTYQTFNGVDDTDLVGMAANEVQEIIFKHFDGGISLRNHPNITITNDGEIISISYNGGGGPSFKTTEGGIKGFVNEILNSEEWNNNYYGRNTEYED